MLELDLEDEDAVREAVARIGLPVIVQPMVRGGAELLAGVVQDPVFGPLVAFGPGGVFAELIGQAQFRIAPLTDADAEEVVKTGKAGRLVSGFRGAPPSDTPALEDVVLRLSRLAEDQPEVAELDLNPVMGLPEGCIVVDARIRARAERRPAHEDLVATLHWGTCEDSAMQALRKVAPEPGLSLEEVVEPRPTATDVVVEVEAASVCGTDLHIHHWDGWASGRIHPPVTLGHEFAGTVVEVGADVRHVSVGGLRLGREPHHVRRLLACRTGNGHMCERTEILGVDRDGAFARYVAVPESVIWKTNRDKLPPEIATLQEPFGNAVFATSEQDLSGRSVAVLGCGPVGLFTVAIAKASGASFVLASDLHPFRLGLARTMGADVVVDASSEQIDHEGVDVVFEMSGSPQAITDAIRIARNGGRVILFGIPSRTVEIDVATAIFKNLTVQAVSGRRIFATWYRTRWLLESGAVDLRPLITHEYGLEDWEQVFAKLEAGEACKIVVYPGVPGGRRPSRPRSPSVGGHEHRRRKGARLRASRRARCAARGGHVQALQHARLPAGARRGDGGPGRGARPLVEQLPRPRRTTGGRRGGDRGLSPLRRGTGSVRFICGTFEPHHELERALADLVGTEASLTYVSCWNANEAAIPTLADENTVILSDELNHASIIDAIRLSRPARKVIYKHSSTGRAARGARLVRADARSGSSSSPTASSRWRATSPGCPRSC